MKTHEILSRIREIRFWLNQMSSDERSAIEGGFLNKAKNELEDLFVNLEADADRGLYKAFNGDPNNWSVKYDHDPL